MRKNSGSREPPSARSRVRSKWTHAWHIPFPFPRPAWMNTLAPFCRPTSRVRSVEFPSTTQIDTVYPAASRWARGIRSRTWPIARSSFKAGRKMTTWPRGLGCGLSSSAPGKCVASSSDVPPPIAAAIMVVCFPSGPSSGYDAQVRGRAARASGLLLRPVGTWENLLQKLRVPLHLIGEEKQRSIRVPARARGDHIVPSELRQMVLDGRVVEPERARNLVRVQRPAVLKQLQDQAPVVPASRSCEQVHERAPEGRVGPIARARRRRSDVDPRLSRPQFLRACDDDTFNCGRHC